MNGYEGELYQVLVTTYVPDDYQKIKDILNNKDNVVLPIEKKGSSQRSSGSLVPSLLNESPFFINMVSRKVEDINTNSQNSSENVKESRKIYDPYTSRELLAKALSKVAKGEDRAIVESYKANVLGYSG